MSHTEKNTTPRRRWLLLMPYVAVILLFVGAEITLRYLSPEMGRPLFKEDRYDQIDWYQLNRNYPARYFPAGTPLIPEFKGGLIRKEKLKNTLRIFCLGESSMFGTPYQMNANIPGILRRQLRHRFPEHDIEVLNVGASAINSNVVLSLSKELIAYKPDLVCMYLGHNEFYGPDGISATFLERTFPSLIQFKYTLRELFLVRKIAAWFSDPADESVERNLMQQVSQGNLVRLDSDEARSVISRFESNVEEIISIWREAGVPVIVSEVSSNLRFPPFTSDPVGPAVKDHIVRLLAKGEYAAARSLIEQQPGSGTNAWLQFMLGEALRGLGNANAARSAYITARDQDLLKFRAPQEVNAAIGRVAGHNNIPLIAADSLLSAASDDGITGERLFWEHLHPTVEGYYRIASLFAETIAREGYVKSGESITRGEVLPFDRDTLRICWLDEAYADLSIARLTSQWPFSEYKREPAVLRNAPPTALAIAEAAYRRALVWDEACYKSAEYFWRSGNVRLALTTYAAVLEEYPTNFYAHYMLGNLLSNMGESAAALHHLNRSVVANPDYPFPRLDAGLLLINQGAFDGALKVLRDALPLTTDPKHAQLRANIFYAIAAAYANKGLVPNALQNLDEALKIRKDYPDALRLRQALLAPSR